MLDVCSTRTASSFCVSQSVTRRVEPWRHGSVVGGGGLGAVRTARNYVPNTLRTRAEVPPPCSRTSAQSCNSSRNYSNRVSRQIRHCASLLLHVDGQTDPTFCNNLRVVRVVNRPGRITSAAGAGHLMMQTDAQRRTRKNLSPLRRPEQVPAGSSVVKLGQDNAINVGFILCRIQYSIVRRFEIARIYNVQIYSNFFLSIKRKWKTA